VEAVVAEEMRDSFETTAKDARGTLKVMTLNVAHGRKMARHQVLLTRSTIEQNLKDIAGVILREAVDVVAMQEADGPSFWSGNFNHVARVGNLVDLEYHFRGAHLAIRARNSHLTYGTAILSRWPMCDAKSHAFAPSPPTPKKGFVIATVTIPHFGRDIDVVSVHLDFLSWRQRKRQIQELIDVVSGKGNPLIVLGDMNCGWGRRNGSLQRLAGLLNLHTHHPTAKIATFPARRPRRRIDWIFVSEELEILQYRSLPDRVSDHLGVVAEVAVRRVD
jgi:endonuclease/exonuclease/phosphatase family metal-dependent hydrolase